MFSLSVDEQKQRPFEDSLSPETGDEDFVILIDKVQAAIIRHEGSDLLSVLDELDSDTLADSRVGLLGLNTDLLKHDSLCL